MQEYQPRAHARCRPRRRAPPERGPGARARRGSGRPRASTTSPSRRQARATSQQALGRSRAARPTAQPEAHGAQAQKRMRSTSSSRSGLKPLRRAIRARDFRRIRRPPAQRPADAAPRTPGRPAAPPMSRRADARYRRPRTALVTGGESRGIGRAIALGLAGCWAPTWPSRARERLPGRRRTVAGRDPRHRTASAALADRGRRGRCAPPWYAAVERCHRRNSAGLDDARQQRRR